MSHKFTFGASHWSVPARIDQSISDEVREAGCPRCGGRLHEAHYPRKPRGLDFLAESGFTRFSFCCGGVGCRRRAAPPSVRQIDRRVCVGPCFLPDSALSGPASAAKARALASGLGVCERTIRRWRRWRREEFPGTPQWRALRGHFSNAPEVGALPRSLLSAFAPAPGGDWLAALRWLLPWTGGLHARRWAAPVRGSCSAT